MRVERIGKQQYAFGMTWSDSGAARPKSREAKAQHVALDPAGSARYYYCVIAANGRYSLGGGTVAGKLSGAVYSYAATLAAGRVDGIYVAPVDDGKLWFCVVRGGIVTPETDVIEDTEKVLASIDGYRALLNFDAKSTFAAEGVAIRGGAEPFDPVAAVAHIKRPVALRLLGSKVSLAPFAVAAAVVIAGVIGYKMYQAHKAKAEHLIVTAQQRQQAIQAYQTSARAALSTYPQNPTWPVAAWRELTDPMPVFLAGWQMKSTDCTLAGCDATYAHAGSGADAVAPFTNLFGKQAVMVDSNGDALKVRLTFPGNHPVDVNDALLHNPPPGGMPILDWIGLTPVHLPGLHGRPTVLATNLAAGGGSQVGYPTFMVDTVTAKGNTSIDTVIDSAIQWGADGSFRVTKFEFTPGVGTSDAPSWTITLARIHR